MHVSACWIKAFVFWLLNKIVAGNGKGSKDKNDREEAVQGKEVVSYWLLASDLTDTYQECCSHKTRAATCDY